MSIHSLVSWRLQVWPLGLIFVALLSALALRAEPVSNFNGSYELAGKKHDRSFSLEILQKGKRADVAFSAAMSDGSGSAPDATGRGEIEDGVLSFRFKDSFHNEGTCTLQAAKGLYRLSMTVTKVVAAGPIHFYGDLLLRKLSVATPPR